MTVESPDLPAVARALSTVVRRSFKAEWGLWAGSQFSAPSVKSEDSLRFRFAEYLVLVDTQSRFLNRPRFLSNNQLGS